MFDLLVDYAMTHSRNGVALAEDSAVRESIARLAVDLEAALVIQDVAASKTAAGMNLHTDAAVLKVFCTEFEARLTNFAVELTGCAGSIIDTGADLHPLVAAASNAQRANAAITIAGGSNEIQRNIIATQGLGLPREP
jgi:3-oxocholest-4-en-26-oyl-CoA dehydrogenase alpha subunit